MKATISGQLSLLQPNFRSISQFFSREVRRSSGERSTRQSIMQQRGTRVM